MNRMKLVRSLSITLILAGGIIFAGETAAQTRNDIRQAKALGDSGDKAFRQKDYKAAADFYGQAIELVPTNPFCHFWKAYSHYYLKEYELAERGFTLALAQGFKAIEVYKVRWYVFYEQKRYDEAISDINRGLGIEPRNALMIKALGDMHYERGSFAESLDAYQNALLITPKDADLYYSIARVQSKTGNIDSQAASADEAIKRGTQFVGEAYYLLGKALERQKNVDRAIDAYQRAISAKPDSHQTYLDLSALFRGKNQVANAIEVLKKGILVFPSDGTLYLYVSRYYSLADRPADAVQAALAAKRFLPDQFMGFTNLCRAYNETKQYREAVAACNSALQQNPGDGETYFYLGRANGLLGKKADAAGFYKKAVTGLVEFTTANPGQSDGFYLLGNAYFADNQRDRAIEAYNKCLELSPNFEKARYNLGIILVLKKDKAGAMTQYSFLLAQDVALAGKLKAEIDKL